MNVLPARPVSGFERLIDIGGKDDECESGFPANRAAGRSTRWQASGGKGGAGPCREYLVKEEPEPIGECNSVMHSSRGHFFDIAPLAPDRRLDRPAHRAMGPCRRICVQVYGDARRPCAAARCSGPVSLATITSARSSNAASCGSVVWPAKLRYGPTNFAATS
jgi:hypothetical protein